MWGRWPGRLQVGQEGGGEVGQQGELPLGLDRHRGQHSVTSPSVT